MTKSAGTVGMRRWCWAAAICLGLFGSLATMAAPCIAQVQVGRPTPLPRPQYYVVFNDHYSGEYRDAAKALERLSRGAYNEGGLKFLDSVCYWTALGESYYRLGDYKNALIQYEAALSLYLDLQAWPTRSQLPTEINPDQRASRRAEKATWATTQRTGSYGQYNNSILVLMGKSDAQNEAVLRNGGVFDPKRMRQVDIAETMRCVALATYRRHVILGPMAAIDPFSRRLTSSLLGNGGATIAAAWGGIGKGVAFFAAGDHARAAQLLKSSLQISGADHPLTPIALMSLGRISASLGKTDEAEQYFLEASICGAAYEQFDIVEESLYYATMMHRSRRTGTAYPPLEKAIGWASSSRTASMPLNPIRAGLCITAAQLAAESGDVKTAESLLANAKSRMGRNDLKISNHQTRWLYTSALTRYVKEDIRSADKDFASFLRAAQKTSLWLFRIQMAEDLVASGDATDRQAEQLYDVLLNEATEADWTYRPIEAMAFTATPHSEPMERWFEITLSRKAEEKAIGISELIRRQRFFDTLPFGGRLLSLRWIMEADPNALSPTALKQRESILARFPDYKDLSDQSVSLRGDLGKMPIQPDQQSVEHAQQKRLLDDLGDITDEQELFLTKLAMTSEPVELTFPKPMGLTDIQAGMQSKQTIVSFLKIGQVYYVMNVAGGAYFIESKIQARAFDKKVLDLLREIGVVDKSTIVDTKIFQREEWRDMAREISTMIFARSDPDVVKELDELVIIPDGKAWYLPFEIIQLGAQGNTESLVDHVRIRYAPTMSLAVPDGRKTRRFGRSGVIAVRNFNRDDEGRIANGVTELQAAVPKIESIDKTVQGPSALLSSTIDQLVVWHESNEKSQRDQFGFSPFQMDAAKAGASVESWMMLPWHGVDELILPGVSSAIEGSKRARADGSDMFLTSMALAASGNRTTLISRWRVGGQSTLDLTREFTMELANKQASLAWNRSLKLFKDTDIDLAAEPRIRDTKLDEPLRASHPYFWSGYMVIDNGNTPNAPAGAEDESEAAEDSGG